MLAVEVMKLKKKGGNECSDFIFNYFIALIFIYNKHLNNLYKFKKMYKTKTIRQKFLGSTKTTQNSKIPKSGFIALSDVYATQKIVWV